MSIKRNKDKNISKRAVLVILLIIAIIALIQLAGSVSFNSNPSINPSTPDTTYTLECSWNASADTTQENVSWYRDGVSVKNETDPAESKSTISSSSTSRGQIWNCTVTLSNGTNTTTVTTNVTITNAPPSEPVMKNSSGDNIGNRTNVTEDQANVFNLTSTDPDNDIVTYGSWDSLPSGASLDSNTGIFTWTPDYDNIDVNITFYAKDNQTPLANTNKFIMFIIQYVNDAPVFSPALANQTINESQVFNYEVTGSDEENNTPLNFSINVTPSLDLVINITSNTTAMIMFQGNRTATYSEAGNYTINVTVNDSLNASTTNSFNLIIQQVNVAPVLQNISTQNGTQGSSLTFYVYANDTDVNDTLLFNITPTGCIISNPWSISTIDNSSSNATGLINISALNNNHVICRDVRIIVIDDVGAEDYQDVFLNISNTNDPPNVEVLSSYSNNTGGNNITNLSTYAQSPFIYKVNATDIDNDTYEGEVLTFGDNATFFDINTSNGLISFTPNQSIVGNHTINITVTDDGGLADNQIMNLEIRNNSAPVLMSIGNLSCAEDTLCFILINATDADNDNLSFTSNNTAAFNLTDNASQSPVISAYVNYTPNQSRVGTHSVVITVTDARGASDNETINFTINNTNDEPVLQAFSFPTIVELHTASLYIHAEDQDYELPSSYAYIPVNGTNYTEYVTFNSTNTSGKALFNVTTYFNTSNNKTYTRLVFTPQIGDAGNYSVNITATDYNNATNWTIKNYTVLAKTDPPNITMIRPYGLPVSSATMFNFTNTSLFNGSISTAINFSENRSVLFNISVTDDTTAQENLTYAWYVNGSINSTSTYVNLSFNFFSSGIYNVTVIVSDDMFENTSWTWNLTVQNINRNPLLINSLNNITINSTTSYPGYLNKTSSVHYIDPDDDLNSNNDFDSGESSSLSYNVTSCDIATISITNNDLTVTPSEVGSCYVTFTATDSGWLSNASNTVLVNVTAVPNGSQEVNDPQPTSGGGGGLSKAVVVPITSEEEQPKTIEIVVPELVTIYANRTVLIPVTIQNNWNDSLLEVRLNASTNDSSVDLSFTEDYFDELIAGEKRNVTLMVENYRLGENYEIRITANVTNPVASDSALVLLNSIEQSESGENVETKVTFAQDLLNDNPECLELNELLEKAKQELETGSREEASSMVDGVINGCKYLVSISKKTEHQPRSIVTLLFEKQNLKYFLVFIGLIIIVTIVTLVIRKRKKISVHEEGEEREEVVKTNKEEEEIKPYWP